MADQQPLPLDAFGARRGSQDESMAEPGGAAEDLQRGGGIRPDPGMADLEEALSLAAAYFAGDPAAVQWAMEGDALPAPDSPLGVLPLDREEDDEWGLTVQWAQEEAEAEAAAELDLSLTPSDPTPPGAILLPAEWEAAAGSDGDNAPESSSEAAAAAADLSEGLLGLQLDDIDTEVQDVVAPGGLLAHLNHVACMPETSPISVLCSECQHVPLPAPLSCQTCVLLLQGGALCRWRQHWRRAPTQQWRSRRRRLCLFPLTWQPLRQTPWLRLRPPLKQTNPSE